MQSDQEYRIFSIGHSTHTFEDFLQMLKNFEIELLVDIRSLPGSNKFPQFNKKNLEIALPENGISYLHLAALGGRRKVHKDSKNTRWHKDAFRAYADYMETEMFKLGIQELMNLAKEKRTAIMCSEAVWWRCHRSMVSDYLKAKGWKVFHIMSKTKIEEHPYTQPARIVNQDVFYDDLPKE